MLAFRLFYYLFKLSVQPIHIYMCILYPRIYKFVQVEREMSSSQVLANAADTAVEEVTLTCHED